MSAAAPQDDIGVLGKSLEAVTIQDAEAAEPIETETSPTPRPPPAPVPPTASTGQLPPSIPIIWHPPRPQEVQAFIDFVDSLGVHLESPLSTQLRLSSKI